MKTDAAGFPFSAIGGAADARQALLSCAVDRWLTGAVLSGGPGNGKSLLLQSFAGFLAKHVDEDLSTRRIPVATAPEALAGGVDFAASLAAGRRIRRPGLLDGNGMFLVENLDLLEPVAAGLLKERLSAAGAQLIATSEPAAPASAAPLPDWIPFWIHLPARFPSSEGNELLARRIRFDVAGMTVVGEWEAAEAALAASIRAARDRLEDVEVPQAAWRALHEAPVAGSRAPLFAVRAARAHAALRGAREVAEPDVAFAFRCVLQPRLDLPTQSTPPQEEQSRPAPDPTSGSAQGQDTVTPQPEVYEPSACDAPPIPQARERAAVATGAARGRAVTLSWLRGRPIGAHPARGRRGRIALAPTLLRAVARDPTPRAGPGPRIRVTRDDLMLSRFAEPTGTLFLLAVDASGSMARNHVREAKGAAVALLRAAYRHRDAVAIVGFAGERAELLLPPTSSLAQARSCIEMLPTGGGTPLASALRTLLELTVAERRARGRPVRAVLLTDGRANVGLSGSGVDRVTTSKELDDVAAAFRSLDVETLVVDTRPRHDVRDDARRVATMLSARYVQLATRDLAGTLTLSL